MRRFNEWEYRDFVLLQVARVLMFTCMSMLSVAVAWHIYDLTNSAFYLGMVGLATFLPKLIFAFIGGDLADRLNRLRILNGTLFGLTCGVAGLFWLTANDYATPTTIMLAVAFNSAFNSTGGPSASAVLPYLVPPQRLSQAIAWGSSLWQASAIAAPALGGAAYALKGHAIGVYGACLACAGVAFLTSLLIRPPQHPLESKGNMLARVREGARFVYGEKVILGAISLDMFAVLLGGAVALMPIYARDILKLGPEGLGLLRAAPAAGAATMAVALAFFPIQRHAGSKMFWGVLVFGIATCVFALSESFWLSAGALAVLGAADMISVVIRHTLEQVRTPGHMRGRVSAVNQVFIGASNELGEFESGLTAHWFGVVPAAFLGGIGTILVVLYWRRLFPQLFATDRLEAT
jgi:MFS family permease